MKVKRNLQEYTNLAVPEFQTQQNQGKGTRKFSKIILMYRVLLPVNETNPLREHAYCNTALKRSKDSCMSRSACAHQLQHHADAQTRENFSA